MPIGSSALPGGDRDYAEGMTSWVGDAGSATPVLYLLARSETDGIHVDWEDAELPADDVPDACAALRRFVESANFQPAAAGQRPLPPRHPHAGELQLPALPDEHRFLEVRLARTSIRSGWSEPSAAERDRGAEVGAPQPARGHVYVVQSFGYGPHRGQPGVAAGPAVPLGALVAAIGSETDRRA